ncbi:PREDICTED: abhydrolase domain-containing protein 2-like isoform X2 [Acropora digitifera]|uniref:abhydrolase domain-containing protein 2-like isoform X2 n=1 Tax=Acropora digitifera TaxID=70779 RepID=UPI00077A9677|nr:PREDICTED: abhydrolase domain-containing protein 2-like isoform X2 [Acropora digitifera]
MAVAVVLIVTAVLLFLIIRILNLTDASRVPKIISSKNPFTSRVLRSCPMLFETYRPPILWGKNGHFQTIIAALCGRKSCPILTGTLYFTQLTDGTVVSYEVFEPAKNAVFVENQEKLTIVIVPGIANCSETQYVRTFADYAMNQGFRVAVLNHLGAKKKEGLSTPRLFTYGGTEELDAVVTHLTSKLNHKRLVGVGFSMGANILMKYLGEIPSRQEYFECGISVCQGYDILRAKTFLDQWNGLRRLYNWGMTQNMKKIIDRHVRVLFEGPNFTSHRHKASIHHVRSSSSLAELDDVYTKKMAGFHHLDDFYARSSCCNYINQVQIPVLLLNALDDPLVPEELYVTPHNHVKSNESAIFVITRHGGHLGFFEGGLLAVNPITWLDKALIQYTTAVMQANRSDDHSPLDKQIGNFVIAS